LKTWIIMSHEAPIAAVSSQRRWRLTSLLSSIAIAAAVVVAGCSTRPAGTQASYAPPPKPFEDCTHLTQRERFYAQQQRYGCMEIPNPSRN
jgi:hypothetical protein